MPVKSDKWGWKHVSVLGCFDKGSGAKKWKCNHCNHIYNGSYSRVRAHLLGFIGCGVKPCPSIDPSSRESLKSLDQDDRFTRKLKIMKKKKSNKKVIIPSSDQLNPGRLALVHLFKTTNHHHPPTRMIDRAPTRDDVDHTVARFLFANGLALDLVDSPFFNEMVKAVGAFGHGYEPPLLDQIAGSLLGKEKARLDRAMGLARESWSHTGCTVLCTNRLDGSVGCFCVDFFVASPRGVFFVKEVDIIEGDGPDNQFIKELCEVISDIGHSNVLQVVTHISGEASDAFESVLVSKFPGVFWSHCSSHSVLFLMEEISQLECVKPTVSTSERLQQCISDFDSNILKEETESPFDSICEKFAPSYCLVRRIVTKKPALQELISSEKWKNRAVTNTGFSAESVISDDNFWVTANSALELFDPFVRQLATFNVDKSVMGDIYNWRVLSLESLRSNKQINESMLNQLEMLVETRWDKLFSPLHGAGYILNPKYFKKTQFTKNNDAHLRRCWEATLERFEPDIEARKALDQELRSYQRGEGCFGDEDAVESMGEMEGVTWWESFGFETPRLQNMAVKVLSQVSSGEVVCLEGCRCQKIGCKQALKMGGDKRAKDFVFVRNNLRIQSVKNKSGSREDKLGACRSC